MKAYGVFEGGGARGVALVGAVHAAEKRGIEFTGVAGTSAGAIVASLLAAGYSGKEIFDASGDKPSGILASDIIVDVLNEADYRRIRRFGRLIAEISKPRSEMATKAIGWAWRNFDWLVWIILPTFIAITTIAFITFPLLCSTLLYVGWLTWVLSFARITRSIWGEAGATDTGEFKKWFNKLLCRKLGLPETIDVTLSQLTAIPLRVVAANLSDRRIHVFSTQSDPDLSVASAVAASISYPVFFKPLRLDGSLFVDGGVVSNFPAWVLDDLRAEQVRRQPTLGFRLLEPDVEIAAAGNLDQIAPVTTLFQRLFSTMLRSREHLEFRQIEDYYPIPIRTHITTLDFHLVETEGKELITTGEEDAERHFNRHFGPARPLEHMTRALRMVADKLKDLTYAQGDTRASLLQKTEAPFCRVVFASFLNVDADDDVLLNLNYDSPALCFSLKQPILMRVAEVSVNDRIRPATKIFHALRPSNITHVYSVPIFAHAGEWEKNNPSERQDPIAALCVDFSSLHGVTDDDLRLIQPEIEDWLSALAQAMGEFWRGDEILTDIQPTKESPAPDWQRIASGFYVSPRKTRDRLPDEAVQELDDLIRSFRS